MTEPAIELVRAAVAAINRGDWAWMRAHLDPGFEYDLSRTDSPLRGVHRGADAVERVAGEFLGTWEAVRYEVHDYLVAGAERVVTPYTTHFGGRDGMELRADAVWEWTLREGRLARVTLFQSLEDALAA